MRKNRSKKEKINIQRTLKEKGGITLIALVITIIILIILATVTLNVVLGEGGLIDRAQLAKDMTEEAVKEEQESLNTLMDEMANIMSEDQIPPKIPETIEEGKESGTPFTDTTTITDDLGNEITIPGGFHIAEDSGTKVEEGIVIEDDEGNQFVWVPVGTYNVSTSINSEGTLTNDLSRRNWSGKGEKEINGDDAIDPNADYFYYGEGNENSVAKDQIEGFKTSAINNKGFYIGRYEQGRGNVCKGSVDAYTNINLNDAKSQAEAMYNGNEFVTSELISSYAWDTALNFICQIYGEYDLLSYTTDSTYGNINTGSKTKTGEYKVDGETSDKYNNIYDFLGNCSEWTTEYVDNSGNGVARGCSYTYIPYGGIYGGFRNALGNESTSDDNSFRLQLYINNI